MKKISIFALLGAIIVVNIIFKVVIIQGNSMSPTLRDGEVLLFGKRKPKVGDIILIDTPKDWQEIPKDHKTLVKRLVGIGGDVVKIRGNRVYINEEYITEVPERMNHNDEVTIKIKEGYGFVLGDNVGHSIDSLYRLLKDGKYDKNFLIKLPTTAYCFERIKE